MLLKFPNGTDADSVVCNVVEFPAVIDADAEERLTLVARDVVVLLLLVANVVDDGNTKLVF